MSSEQQDKAEPKEVETREEVVMALDEDQALQQLKAEDTLEETPDESSVEDSTSENEPKDKPSSFDRKIAKATAKRKEAEEKLAEATVQSEQIQKELDALKAKADVSLTVPPDRLDEAVVESAREMYRVEDEIAFLEEHLDGVEDVSGLEDMEPSEVRARLKKLRPEYSALRDKVNPAVKAVQTDLMEKVRYAESLDRDRVKQALDLLDRYEKVTPSEKKTPPKPNQETKEEPEDDGSRDYLIAALG